MGRHQDFGLYEKPEILNLKCPSAFFPVSREGKQGSSCPRSHSRPLIC